MTVHSGAIYALVCSMDVVRAAHLVATAPLLQVGCACLQTCSKQYKNAAEMEAHLSSYDHHHKKVSMDICTVCTRLDKRGTDV